MGKGADYVILYQHMETTARLFDVQTAIERDDRAAARQAIERALDCARQTARMIEQTARDANDPR
jgi:hypothetical protein